MAHFKTKGAEVDAIRWTGANWQEVFAFVNPETDPEFGDFGYMPSLGTFDLPASTGPMDEDVPFVAVRPQKVNPGDWVVRVGDQLACCRASLFDEIFEPATRPSNSVAGDPGADA
jgi:hypothetical protein